MKKIILQVSIVMFLMLSISAQENQLQLIDEINNLQAEYLRELTVGHGWELNKNPNSKMVVRIYGGNGKNFGDSYFYGSVVKSSWENFARFPTEKLAIQFCNINNEPFSIKFFSAQADAEVESCAENLKMPQKTVLFDVSYFDMTDFSGSEIDFGSLENTYISCEGSGAIYSVFAQNALKKLLQDSPESKLYIIGYLSRNFLINENSEIFGKLSTDKKSRLNKMFRAAHKELLKNGFSNSQIKMIAGGYVNNSRRLEFWIVPKGGETPKAKPTYLPKKK